MYYIAELNKINKNKIDLNFFKITKNSKTLTSKEQYDNYFKRLYNNKNKNTQNGGMIDLSKFKKNPTYSVNYYNKYNSATDNDINPNQVNLQSYPNDIIMNNYESEHQYLVIGLEKYADTERQELIKKYKNTNNDIPTHKKIVLGVFPIKTESINKLRNWCNQTCKYEILNKDKKLGMYIYDSNYNVNGFIDSKNCKDYNSGAYYIKPYSRKGYIQLLTQGNKNWLAEDIIYEYPGKIMNKM